MFQHNILYEVWRWAEQSFLHFQITKLEIIKVIFSEYPSRYNIINSCWKEGNIEQIFFSVHNL